MLLHVQVPHEVVDGKRQKRTAKLLGDHQTPNLSKGADPVKSIIGSNQSLDTIKAGRITTPERQAGVGSGQADVDEGQKVGTDGQSGQGVAGVIPDAFSKTTSPGTDAQTKKPRKGRKKGGSTKNLIVERGKKKAGSTQKHPFAAYPTCI